MKNKLSGCSALRIRDRRFGRGEAHRRWWVGGDPYATAFYNALSITFPIGEAFFIESLRKFRAEVPAELGAEIIAFTMQEAHHTREHVAFNRKVKDAGYDVRPLEAMVAKRLDRIRAKPPISSLAATMGLEHLTAIIAHQVLANPVHLEGAEAETAAMWQWHAVEEIEHKGVAYDVWLHVTRDWPRFRRWRTRARAMLLVTRNFMVDRARGMIELLRQDGITGPRAWARLFWFCLVQPGMIRLIWQGWFTFFLPGFHPWRHDDAYLIERFDDRDGTDETEATPAGVAGIPGACAA